MQKVTSQDWANAATLRTVPNITKPDGYDQAKQRYDDTYAAHIDHPNQAAVDSAWQDFLALAKQHSANQRNAQPGRA